MGENERELERMARFEDTADLFAVRDHRDEGFFELSHRSCTLRSLGLVLNVLDRNRRVAWLLSLLTTSKFGVKPRMTLSIRSVVPKDSRTFMPNERPCTICREAVISSLAASTARCNTRCRNLSKASSSRWPRASVDNHSMIVIVAVVISLELEPKSRFIPRIPFRRTRTFGSVATNLMASRLWDASRTNDTTVAFCSISRSFAFMAWASKPMIFLFLKRPASSDASFKLAVLRAPSQTFLKKAAGGATLMLPSAAASPPFTARTASTCLQRKEE